jgi:hypothetical protein
VDFKVEHVLVKMVRLIPEVVEVVVLMGHPMVPVVLEVVVL